MVLKIRLALLEYFCNYSVDFSQEIKSVSPRAEFTERSGLFAADGDDGTVKKLSRKPVE